MTAYTRTRYAGNAWLVSASKLILIALLLVPALGIRLAYASDPPTNFHATRQYRSLIIARGLYAETNPQSVAEWQQDVYRVARERQGILEPPIMEAIAATGYRIAGREQFWIPRLLSSFFWLVGGVFLLLIARRLSDDAGALVSLGIYLFLPFGVVASRSFQPDPLVIMLMLASVFAVVRYWEQQTDSRLATAIAVSSLTFFVKPISLFAVVSVFLALSICIYGVRRTALNLRTVSFVAVSLLPMAAFYIYGIYIDGFLRTQADSSFLPRLLTDPFFWRGWLSNIGQVTGFVVLVLALFGLTLTEKGQPRAILLGLWAGYAAFCATFSYHIATHDYYHLQLVPIASLSIAPLASLLATRFRSYRLERHWQVATFVTMSATVLLALAVTQPRLANADAGETLAVAEEVGRLVNHSTETVFLSSDYGLSLEYHGELSGVPWPLSSDLEWERLAGVHSPKAEERFENDFADARPEYFIVLDLWELEQQPGLEEYLITNFPLISDSDDYLVFALDRRPS